MRKKATLQLIDILKDFLQKCVLSFFIHFYILLFLYLKKIHQCIQAQLEFVKTLIRKIVLYFRAQRSSDESYATFYINDSKTASIFFLTLKVDIFLKS